MDNKLTEFLINHEKARKLTSSEVTYDRFVYDSDYSPMYISNESGIFRPLNPLLQQDWSKKVFINLFRTDISSRYSTKPVVMDIGSGTGFPTFHISDIAEKVYSVDYSSELQNFAERNKIEFCTKNVEIVNAKGEELPFCDNSMDCVIMSHYLEFTYDPIRALSELSRVLKPNGYLVGLTSNWKQAINRVFGHLDRDVIHYPLLRAEVKELKGERLLKYRVCTLNPHFEKTFYLKIAEHKHLELLAEVINEGRLNMAIAILSELDIEYIQFAICRQFDEQSIMKIYSDCGFDMITMHGVRVPIQDFIQGLLTDEDCDFDYFSQNFDKLARHMVRIVRSTSPIYGFDMYVVVKNMKS